MFHNWASDPEVTKFLTWPPHKSAELTRTLLEEWSKEYEKDDYYQWGIELKSLGEVIGTISVVGMKETIDMAHIGYCIGRAWWHQGTMRAADRNNQGICDVGQYAILRSDYLQ